MMVCNSFLVFYYLNISGSTETFRLHAFKSLLLMMMQLTDCSPQLCRELGLTGFVALLNGFLENLASQLLLNEVITVIHFLFSLLSVVIF